jgi:hypothetical protein
MVGGVSKIVVMIMVVMGGANLVTMRRIVAVAMRMDDRRRHRRPHQYGRGDQEIQRNRASTTRHCFLNHVTRSSGKIRTNHEAQI